MFFCGTIFSYSQRVLKDNIAIFYETDNHNLNLQQKNKVLNFIKHYDDAKINKIVIVSSADYKGNKNYNLNLSKKRASLVANYIKENRNLKIQTKYLGEKEKPKSQKFKDGVTIHRKTNIICEYILPKSKSEKLKYNEKIKENYLEKLNEIDKNKSLRLRNINFYYGKTKTIKASKKEQEKLLQIMINNNKLSIELEGHVCCGKSKNKENDNEDSQLNTLSTRRAKKIHDYLLERGIDSSRISYKGYEFKKPIYYPEKNERHRSLNRRVEVKVIAN
jgi:outer membrane protein OmpA-like peptidoglycan-associated protein